MEIPEYCLYCGYRPLRRLNRPALGQVNYLIWHCDGCGRDLSKADWDKEGWLARLYRVHIWSKYGGRPWTHIMRDTYHDMPLVVLLIAFSSGVIFGKWASWRMIFWSMMLIGAGLVLGHLFW